LGTRIWRNKWFNSDLNDVPKSKSAIP
jgi:hypothetical protein